MMSNLFCSWTPRKSPRVAVLGVGFAAFRGLMKPSSPSVTLKHPKKGICASSSSSLTGRCDFLGQFRDAWPSSLHDQHRRLSSGTAGWGHLDCSCSFPQFAHLRGGRVAEGEVVVDERVLVVDERVVEGERLGGGLVVVVRGVLEDLALSLLKAPMRSSTVLMGPISSMSPSSSPSSPSSSTALTPPRLRLKMILAD